MYLENISHVVNEAVNRASDLRDFQMILSIRMEEPTFIIENLHRDILLSPKFSRIAYRLFKTQGCVSHDKIKEFVNVG